MLQSVKNSLNQPRLVTTLAFIIPKNIDSITLKTPALAAIRVFFEASEWHVMTRGR